MDGEVEEWIDILIKNGTFESRHDIYEFCVYAVKVFSEENEYTQKTIREQLKPIDFDDLPAVKNPDVTQEEIDAMKKLMKNPFPIKLPTWKIYFKEYRGKKDQIPQPLCIPQPLNKF